MKNNENKSMDDILRDTKHNKKANTVFLKLLAKQRKPKNPFDEVRSQTYPTKEIKPGADDV
jgi:hypothetical protein